ncbi:MAG: M67 family metallopeptidase [Candidatus Dormiibacterota bacterium]
MAGRSLEFLKPMFERMRQLAEAAYPYEGCGVLVGRRGPEAAVVTEVVEGRNLVTERRRDRYELDPRDIITAERSARNRGEEVLGFFHTHPDHPARPSQFDTEHAWPKYHYVVIAVDDGRMAGATAWELTGPEGDQRFEERPLATGEGAAPGYNPPGVVVEIQ